MPVFFYLSFPHGPFNPFFCVQTRFSIVFDKVYVPRRGSFLRRFFPPLTKGGVREFFYGNCGYLYPKSETKKRPRKKRGESEETKTVKIREAKHEYRRKNDRLSGLQERNRNGKGIFLSRLRGDRLPRLREKEPRYVPTVFFSARKVQLKRIFRAEKTLREKSAFGYGICPYPGALSAEKEKTSHKNRQNPTPIEFSFCLFSCIIGSSNHQRSR